MLGRPRPRGFLAASDAVASVEAVFSVADGLAGAIFASTGAMITGAGLIGSTTGALFSLLTSLFVLLLAARFRKGFFCVSALTLSGASAAMISTSVAGVAAFAIFDFLGMGY
ncbi:MAG: hypothetical protein KIH69_015300 [Anaerolineae bacterium]|nr:hypothetical protein [Anaerolineae bacterium]